MLNIKLPSNRKFGYFFTVIFSISCAYAYGNALHVTGAIMFCIAIFFLFSAILFPKLLTPINILWFRLGHLLGQITSPIILGIIFFMLITPTSLLLRMLGRDELKIKKISLNSYWVDRSPPGPAPNSFRNQY